MVHQNLTFRKFPPQNQWTALCAANEMVGEFAKSQILVYLYNKARTCFIKNF